jgi:poly-gamma-glutamate capsule biosynthesis protein CapA/YwtB (metallophosphatase superfamily)
MLINQKIKVLLIVIVILTTTQIAFGDTVSTNPEAERLYQEGIYNLKIHKLDLAEESLLKSLKLDPENGKIHWETGWVYWQMRNWTKTVYHWEMTKQYTPDQKDLEKYYTLASQYLERKRQSDSQHLYFESDVQAQDDFDNTITITAVGDIMMGSDFPEEKKRLPGNVDVLFDSVRPFLTGHVVMGNLEGPLTTETTSTKPTDQKSYFVFRSPPEYSNALKNAGFTIMNLANNHIHDFGPNGIEDTTFSLESQGIHYFGTLDQPCAIVKTPDATIGFLGVSTQYYSVSINDLNQCRQLIRELKQSVDIVVVTFHGGAEGLLAGHTPKTEEFYYGESRGDVYKFAHAMIDEGADMVVGHGPHILRGMELYKEKPIAYSMGNFLGYLKFSTSGDLGYTAILQIKISKSGVLKRVKIIPLKLTPQNIPEIDQSGYAILLLNELSQTDFGSNALMLDENGEWESGSTLE